jgi:hypothetical protein
MGVAARSRSLRGSNLASPTIVVCASALRKKMSINSDILLMRRSTFCAGADTPAQELTISLGAGDGGLFHLAIAGVAKPGEAEQHHRPGGRFGDGAGHGREFVRLEYVV